MRDDGPMHLLTSFNLAMGEDQTFNLLEELTPSS